MPERPFQLLFTCEHATNHIPPEYRSVAMRAGAALETHRGYDPGAMELMEEFARRLRAPISDGRWSRLLIDLNRSLHHRQLFSEFSRTLPEGDKRRLIEEYYKPYRTALEKHVRKVTGRNERVIHIGVHSFTPVLRGQVRNADLGLLYDPQRKSEREFCRRWCAAIRSTRPDLRVRNNYPYRGTDDGLTTAFRRLFDEQVYLGIELEVNQRFPLGPGGPWRELQDTLVNSLEQVLSMERR